MPAGPPVPSLTPRELEVLQLIVQGKSNKEIAAVLELSANTVSVHRANLMQTLDIHNTAELVVYAIRKGLVSIAVTRRSLVARRCSLPPCVRRRAVGFRLTDVTDAGGHPVPAQ